MTNDANPYCEALGINVPDLAVAKESPDANYYSLLLVVLLERGGPVTLNEAALRFEEAGVAPADRALQSLKRCQPGRPPVYRDGDLYALDPYDDEADLWAFRLGLRPPKAAAVHIVRPDPEPMPSIDSALTVAHLDEAWRDGLPSNSSAQRIALCVLDAHEGPMKPEEVVAFVSARSQSNRLSVDSAKHWRMGAIRVRDDGLWEVNRAHPALRSARQAVVERIEVARRWAHQRPDPVLIAARQKHFERQRDAHARELAGMRRALLYGFPAKQPEALVLVDVAERQMTTFFGDAMRVAVEKLADYEIIAAIDVRGLLRSLDFDPGARRLGELGPPQKSIARYGGGRVLKITSTLLVRGSCRISRPFGDRKRMLGYLEGGRLSDLRRRLEEDAKSLYALYQYGRLHGCVRLRSGQFEAFLPAPWVHRDEATLYELKKDAYERSLPLEVVLGPPDWHEPWSQMHRAHVDKEEGGWRSWLVHDDGWGIDEHEIQLARLAT